MVHSEAHEFYQLGLSLASQTQFAEAQAAWQEAWHLDPATPQPLLDLAQMQEQQNDLTAAHQTLSEILQLHPDHIPTHLAFGRLFHLSGQLEYALQYYRSALNLDPNQAEAWHQLGRLLQQINRPLQAEDAFQHALSLAPNQALFHNSLGLIYFFQQKTSLAREHLLQANQLQPDHAPYALNLALSYLQEPLDLKASLQAFDQAILLQADLLKELYSVGEHFFQYRNYWLASSFFAQILKHDPGHFDTRLRLGVAAEMTGRHQVALDHYQEAMRLEPDQWLISLHASLLQPLIYHSQADLDSWRDRLRRNLIQLLVDSKEQNYQPSQHRMRLLSSAFNLAYQGHDNTYLLAGLSRLWSKLLILPRSERQTVRKQKKRIGILSAFLFQHSITGVYFGLVQQWQQREDVELYFFSIGQLKQDQISQALQAAGQWVVCPRHASLTEIAQTVIDAEIDLLIYPELGMDPITYLLAHGRLAPVQAALYGHPITSGIGQIDYFLSAACAEPADADSHYIETLVRLPGVPFYFKPSSTPSGSTSELNLPTGNIYLIAGTLFKVHPQQDLFFAQIFETDPLAQLVFIKDKEEIWAPPLRARFEESLAPWLERIHFIPWLASEDYFALLQQADVVLDTFYFSSGNVAFQCFAQGTPILTWPGPWMRSRTTAGIYQEMGISDCIARDPEHLLALSQRLISDSAWKQSLQTRIRQAAEPIFESQQACAQAAQIITELKPR